MSKNRNHFLSEFGHDEHLSKIYNESESIDRFLKAKVVRNSAAPKSVITAALNDKHPYVRNAVLENPNTPSKHLTAAMNTYDEDSAIAVMKNSNASAKHISTALSDKFSHRVHKLAVIHKNTTDDHIKIALNHDDSNVRLSCVEHNPNLDIETLKRVNFNDPSGDVSDAAYNRQRKMENE